MRGRGEGGQTDDIVTDIALAERDGGISGSGPSSSSPPLRGRAGRRCPQALTGVAVVIRLMKGHKIYSND